MALGCVSLCCMHYMKYQIKLKNPDAFAQFALLVTESYRHIEITNCFHLLWKLSRQKKARCKNGLNACLQACMCFYVSVPGMIMWRGLHCVVIGSNSSSSVGQRHRKLPSTFSQWASPHNSLLISHSSVSVHTQICIRNTVQLVSYFFLLIDLINCSIPMQLVPSVVLIYPWSQWQ